MDAFGSGFKNSAEVTAMIDNVRAANANMLVPEVRKRGDAYYLGSPYEPKATDMAAGFDSLQDMINKAHDTSGGKARIDVHAWIVSFKIWGSQLTPPAASTPPHPYNAHPDWLTQDYNGASWDGTSYSFDPGHPEVQKYTYNVCLDIITRYDIDGFNFDYIRYTGNDWGYHPVTVARFNSRYARTGKPAPTDPLWLQFRRDQVTALVRKVYLNAIALKPSIKISADTITWGSGPTSDAQWLSSSSAYTDVLQDWRSWMQEGILDLNIPMAYYRQHELPGGYLNWMNFAKDRKFNRHLAVGPGIYLNYTTNAITQMRLTRSASPSGNAAEGVCGYVYKQPDNQGTSFATFKNYLTTPSAVDPITPPIFSAPVAVPVMPWKSSPTKGYLKGFVHGGSATNALDGAVVTLSGTASRGQTNDATGFYGFVDLAPGAYSINATCPGYLPASTNVTITAGVVSTRDLTLTLIAAPAIAAQPNSQTVYENGSASFVVSAVGSAPLSYQWRLHGTNLPGATTSIYTLSIVALDDAGPYQVVVTNSIGSVTSQTATLTVAQPQLNERTIPLWTIPADSRAYVTSGVTERGLSYNPANNHLLVLSRAGSAQIQVLNADSGGELYAMNLGSGVISGGTFVLNLVGVAADGAVYAANLTTDSMASNFRLYRWANDGASATPTVAYSGNPSPNGGRWGDTLDVRGNGANTQIIIGSRNGTNVVVFTTANGTTFTPVNLNVSGVAGGAFGLGLAFGSGNTFWGKATGTSLRRYSFDLAGGTAVVAQTYAATAMPSTVSAIAINTNLNYLAGLSLDTPDNLQVYDYLQDNSVAMVETNAFPSDTFNSNLTGAIDFGGDRVFALGTCNGIIAYRVLARATPPAIAAQPQSLGVIEGNDAVFSVGVTGTAPLKYQWRFNAVPIFGATDLTYTRMNAQVTHNGGYSVVVSNMAGVVTSAVAMLTVQVPPAIVSQPTNLTLKAWGNATFSVGASGTAPLAYQWHFNSAIIPGATRSTYTRQAVQEADAGVYWVRITNVAGSLFSQEAALTVLPIAPPQVTGITLAPGGWQISGTGDPGTFLVQVSSDLVQWSEAASLPVTNGTFSWIDSQTNWPQRFYRVVWTP